MIPESLLEQERRFRLAVNRRQYGDIASLLAEMRRIVDQDRRPEVAKCVQSSIRWARLMVATQRQICADELELLPLVNRYLERSPETRPEVCVDL